MTYRVAVIPGDGMRVSFYFVDYDRLNRGMKMIVKDGDTEEELMQQDSRKKEIVDDIIKNLRGK